MQGERYRLDKAIASAASLDSMYDAEAARTSPLFGTGGLTIEQVEKRYRMENVLGAMRPGDVSVLEARFIEHQTLEMMARDTGVSRQAVLKRIQAAKQNFYVAFDQHWEDQIGGVGWDGHVGTVRERKNGQYDGSTDGGERPSVGSIG